MQYKKPQNTKIKQKPKAETEPSKQKIGKDTDSTIIHLSPTDSVTDVSIKCSGRSKKQTMCCVTVLIKKITICTNCSGARLLPTETREAEVSGMLTQCW